MIFTLKHLVVVLTKYNLEPLQVSQKLLKIIENDQLQRLKKNSKLNLQLWVTTFGLEFIPQALQLYNLFVVANERN